MSKRDLDLWVKINGENWYLVSAETVGGFAEAIRAEAWEEGANAAIEVESKGTYLTLRAVIPHPENPYRKNDM